MGISLYKKALEVFTPLNEESKELFVRINNSLGVVYWLNGSYVDALEIFHSTLPQAQSLENQTHTKDILLNIGLVYREQRDYVKTIEYFQKTYDQAISTNDQRLIAMCSDNLGNAYVKTGKAEKAIDFLIGQ